MRMRVLRENLRVEIENETRVFLESLNFEIEMRVWQKSSAQKNAYYLGISRIILMSKIATPIRGVGRKCIGLIYIHQGI